MKFFRLKHAEIVQGTTLVSTIALCRTALNNVPRGIKLDDMRARMRVLDALDVAERESALALSLEDADVKTLQKCVREVEWTVVSKGVLSFADAVENAMRDTRDEAEHDIEASTLQELRG